jgi:23S rRNA pseudouridine955/2504/2580 synthase
MRLRVADPDAGLRADAFVSREMPGLSRTRVRQKIQGGDALLNGRRFATSTRLRAGDEIVVPLRAPLRDEPAAALPVLYEDEHLLAVDKPAGIATHPTGGIQSGTVIQFARSRSAGRIRERLAQGDRDWYPRPVNRLDVFTSGIVLVALTREAQKAMQVLLLERRIRKEYLALVEGVVPWDAGTILLATGSDPASTVRVKMAALPGGRPTVTRIRVLKRLSLHTLVEASPQTGRQHQIRVHLAAVGHPVVGDLLYRDERLFLRYQEAGRTLDESLPARHFLHAARVSFVHPFTGRALAIESPLPAELTAALDAALERRPLPNLRG